jgi:hypothetical protein
MPHYPVYVVSKGRYQNCLTVQFLIRDGTPFELVVEREQAEQYAKYGVEHLRLLPRSDQGLIYARNWCFDDALERGAARFWILDDNIYHIKRRQAGRRIPCNSDLAFRCIEDFVDRYENVGLAGLNYEMFAPNGHEIPPFFVNTHVYSCTLVNTSLPYRWRSYLNDDTDLCLQVLSGGWCTVVTNAFIQTKVRTMKLKGGNTPIYQGDGRLKMARSLERLWPGVVTVNRRFKRPQHVIANQWQRFTTPLRLKPDLPPPDPEDYRMEVRQIKPVKAASLREWMEERRPR